MKKGLIILALFYLFFPSLSYSFDTTSNNTKHLSEQRYWQQLLHFRDGKSEIDSANFFLATDGKTNPKAELEATLEAIKQDKSVYCRFPARVKWLYQQLPNLEKTNPYQKCTELEEIINNYQASKAVLVFPTAHINSPASMFGHTFLRIDDKTGLPLTANAINYAANTQESNGLAFAYKGLFGGYEGRYSVLPYYKKIKEYSNLERRDVWEYELNLNQTEMTRLLTHLYEVKDTYADYFFFTENCSYNLLWLLEIARKDSYLVSKFDFQVIPIDTVREVQEAGFIVKSKFRPSKAKRIKSLVEEEKHATGKLKEAYQSEIRTELLQLKRSENSIEKGSYIKQLMENLAKRSQLPVLPKVVIKAPPDPMHSHKTSRVGLAWNSQDELELSIKAAFHDIYDLEKGFIKGAYIDFFNLKIAKMADDKVNLKELNLLNINSYAIRDSVFKPLSWGIAVGAIDFRNKTNFKLTGEVGLTYGLGASSLAFMMLKPALYYRDEIVVSIGPKLGFIRSFDSYKIGVFAIKNYFNKGEEEVHAELFSTISSSKNTAVNLKVTSDRLGSFKSDETYSISLFYYF